MKYTSGIRKIFIHRGFYKTFEEVTKLANDSNYQVLAFDGYIYVYEQLRDKWHLSPFTIHDFKIG